MKTRYPGTSDPIREMESRTLTKEADAKPGSPFQIAKERESLSEGESAHTPGPWRVIAESEHRSPTIQSQEETPFGRLTVAEIHGESYAQRESNARLIAAAPELLAASKALFALIESGVLVRDISHDADPKWYLKAIELTTTLKRAQEAIQHAQEAAQ